MAFKVGDVVFSRTGRPGVVEHVDTQGRMDVATSQKVRQKEHPFGYVNGLARSEKAAFHDILKEAYADPEPEKRIAFLQSKIRDLEQNPEQRKLVSYLKSELAHVMFSSGVTPTSYSLPPEAS